MHSMFGVTEESYLFDFQDTGKLDKPRDRDTAGVWHRLTEEEISLMDEQELDAIFEKLCRSHASDIRMKECTTLTKSC